MHCPAITVKIVIFVSPPSFSETKKTCKNQRIYFSPTWCLKIKRFSFMNTWTEQLQKGAHVKLNSSHLILNYDNQEDSAVRSHISHIKEFPFITSQELTKLLWYFRATTAHLFWCTSMPSSFDTCFIFLLLCNVTAAQCICTACTRFNGH